MLKAYLFIFTYSIIGKIYLQKKRGQGKAKGVYPGHNRKCEIHDRRSFFPIFLLF